jgi:hypothetical protein
MLELETIGESPKILYVRREEIAAVSCDKTLASRSDLSRHAGSRIHLRSGETFDVTKSLSDILVASTSPTHKEEEDVLATDIRDGLAAIVKEHVAKSLRTGADPNKAEWHLTWKQSFQVLLMLDSLGRPELLQDAIAKGIRVLEGEKLMGYVVADCGADETELRPVRDDG